MFESYPDILSAEDVSEMLGICKGKVYSLLKDGYISSLKVGRKYLIPKKSVIAFIDGTCDNQNRIIDSRLSYEGGIKE